METLIDSAKYKANSQKRVKKVPRYATSERFLRDILQRGVISIPRRPMVQFLEKKPGDDTNFLGINAGGGLG